MSFKERESTASAGGILSRQGKVHGLVTFGVTTLIGFYLLTSALGQGIGGAGSFVSSVVNAAGKGVASAAPGLVDSAKQKLLESPVDPSSIQSQWTNCCARPANRSSSPKNCRGALDQAQNTAQNSNDLKDMVSRALGQNGDVVKAADRDALINVIMSRTGKSRPEAEQS